MELEENIEELKRLFYTNSLTQYGKRKLINYYEQQIQRLKNNSIPKEKVEKVFETKIYNTNYLADTDWTEHQREVDLRVVELLKVIKQELLEE